MHDIIKYVTEKKNPQNLVNSLAYDFWMHTVVLTVISIIKYQNMSTI